MAVAMRSGGSGSSLDKQLDSGKYVRYTAEQVEALERVYAECPKPSSIRRQQLIRECPILSNIEPKQIKVWFQNRRFVLPEFVLDSKSFILKIPFPHLNSIIIVNFYLKAHHLRINHTMRNARLLQ